MSTMADTEIAAGPNQASSHRAANRLHPVLTDRLFTMLQVQAESVHVASVTIGLGYTAVQTSAGDLGLSYTMAGRSLCCKRLRRERDLDGALASEVLTYLCSEDCLERSLGVALANALNQQSALAMPEDTGLLTSLASIRPGMRVAMVGFMPPVVSRLKCAGAEVSVLDADLGIGNEVRFLNELASWPHLLIVTATTVLNGTYDEFVESLTPGVPVIMLGPTTPMLPEAYGPRVFMLGGLVALDNSRVLSAVRQAAFTPAVSANCRRIYWSSSDLLEAPANGPHGHPRPESAQHEDTNAS